VRILEPAHLYHASLSKQDYDLMVRIRDGDVERDWNEVEATGEKNQQIQDGHQNMARFNYYDGLNPDWPEQILDAEYEMAIQTVEKIRTDDRTQEQILEENAHPDSPIYTKGLTQVMLGAPQSMYNGGLLRATVRYFDQDRGRPGLPPDVAALVDQIEGDKAGVQLVNLSPSETRNVIVQAGAFGEHQFTGLTFHEDDQHRSVPVDSKNFAVQLPPSTAIRVEARMNRFANDPSYAFPWHGDKIPIPYQ
jgi:hypothetical protein